MVRVFVVIDIQVILQIILACFFCCNLKNCQIQYRAKEIEVRGHQLIYKINLYSKGGGCGKIL